MPSLYSLLAYQWAVNDTKEHCYVGALSYGLWSLGSVMHDSMCWKWRMIYRWWLRLVDRSTCGYALTISIILLRSLIFHLGGYQEQWWRVSTCELPLLRTHGQYTPENKEMASLRHDHDETAVQGWGSRRWPTCPCSLDGRGGILIFSPQSITATLASHGPFLSSCMWKIAFSSSPWRRIGVAKRCRYLALHVKNWRKVIKTKTNEYMLLKNYAIE